MCMFFPNREWSDREVDAYLRECASKAKNTGEYTNLLSLKRLGYTDDITARLEIDIKRPFRLSTRKSCVSSCCGICTKKCNRRCIQDCLHKLWIEALSNSKYSEMAMQILTDEQTTKETIVDATNSIFAGEVHPRREGYEFRDDATPNMLRFRYEPVTLYEEHPERPAHRRRFNPETGQVLYISWPNSGLCPFCMPRVLQSRGGWVRNGNDSNY